MQVGCELASAVRAPLVSTPIRLQVWGAWSVAKVDPARMFREEKEILRRAQRPWPTPGLSGFHQKRFGCHIARKDLTKVGIDPGMLEIHRRRLARIATDIWRYRSAQVQPRRR